MKPLRFAASTGALALLIGVLAAAAAPGYRPPEAYPVTVDADVPTATGTLPAHEHHVRLTVRGHEISAVLTAPTDPDFALVYLHGAGGDDRATARVAAHLAAAGVAVLVPEKITENYSLVHRDYALLGDDAVDAAAWLHKHLDLPAERVGLLGASEGGWAALLAAEDFPGPLVLNSAPVITPLEQAAHVMSVDPVRRIITGLIASGRAFLSYLDTDVRPVLPQLHNQVIAVYGVDDPILPVGQAVTRLTDGLPTPPHLILVPGAHMPNPQAWAGAVAKQLSAPQPHVAGVAPDPRGAPTPPEPTWLLDPRLHLLAAALIASRHLLGARS